MAVTKTYGTGTTSSSYTPNVYDEYDMVGKVALEIIKQIDAKNPLNVFDQYKVDNGDTIEQVVVKLVESSEYDATGADALTPDRTEKFAVRYFKDWARETYKTTIDKSELRKVLINNKSASDVADKIVSQLGNSDRHEKFGYIKDLFSYGVTSNTFVPIVNTAIDLTTTDGYKTLLKAIKDTITGMTFVSDDFNSASFTTASKLDDILIVMPYKLKNAIDVDELSGVFNLDKSEIKKRIIQTDSSENYCYIVDKNAIVVATRLFEMENQKNASALTWNYFLHVERMYGLSALFNACYISYTM